MPAFLFDSNIWIALSFATHPAHSQARRALGAASSSLPACFCRATEQSYLRLVTSPKLHQIYGAQSVTNRDAIVLLAKFQAQPHIIAVDEPSDTRNLWLRLAARAAAAPRLWMDAYLAAFAIKADLSFVSFDQGFQQFEKDGLKLILFTS